MKVPTFIVKSDWFSKNLEIPASCQLEARKILRPLDDQAPQVKEQVE